MHYGTLLIEKQFFALNIVFNKTIITIPESFRSSGRKKVFGKTFFIKLFLKSSCCRTVSYNSLETRSCFMFQVTLPRWCGKIQNIWELPNQGRREEKSLLWQITIHQETLSDNTKTMFSKPNKI